MMASCRPLAAMLLFACQSTAGGLEPPRVVAEVPATPDAPAAAGSLRGAAEPGAPAEIPGRKFSQQALASGPASMVPADFAVIGDYGQDGAAEAAVAALVASWSPRIVVTTGDNNYRDGSAATFEANVAKYWAPWIAFGPGYRGRYRRPDEASRTPRFFPALGNHDWHTEGARDHLNSLTLPGNGRYYSVDEGEWAFFIMDSDVQPATKLGLRDADVQAAWLEKSLKASQARAKIVVFHHPPYSVGPHKSALWMRLPFAKWGASLVLNGHNHDYERHVVDGLPYVVNGFGGAWANDLGSACKMPESSFDTCTSNTFGAMRGRKVKASDSASAVLRLEALTIDGRVVDAFSLPL